VRTPNQQCQSTEGTPTPLVKKIVQECSFTAHMPLLSATGAWGLVKITCNRIPWQILYLPIKQLRRHCHCRIARCSMRNLWPCCHYHHSGNFRLRAVPCGENVGVLLNGVKSHMHRLHTITRTKKKIIAQDVEIIFTNSRAYHQYNNNDRLTAFDPGQPG